LLYGRAPARAEVAAHRRWTLTRPRRPSRRSASAIASLPGRYPNGWSVQAAGRVCDERAEIARVRTTRAQAPG